MALFGYDVEEEAKEVVTEAKQSRGTFVVLFLAVYQLMFFVIGLLIGGNHEKMKKKNNILG